MHLMPRLHMIKHLRALFMTFISGLLSPCYCRASIFGSWLLDLLWHLSLVVLHVHCCIVVVVSAASSTTLSGMATFVFVWRWNCFSLSRRLLHLLLRAF